MRQLVFANISVKGWVIDSYQYCLLVGPGNALVLPAYYAEIVQKQFMTSDVMMVMER